MDNFANSFIKIQEPMGKAEGPTGLIQKPFDLEIFNIEPTKVQFGYDYLNLKALEELIQEAKDTGFADEGTGGNLEEVGMVTPKRNPSYWKSSPLLSDITTDVSDTSIRNILNTIKGKESGGDYSAKNPKASASGGYQFINKTWRSLTSKYGIGSEYSSARDAPPEIQDRVAAEYVKDILKNNNNDVSKVPLVWYTGNAAGKLSQELIDFNGGLTPAEYQYSWLKAYNKNLGGQK